MVQVKEDPIKMQERNKDKIDNIFSGYGFDILEKSDNGSIIGDHNIRIARYYYLVSCNIYGSAERFIDVAEEIENELGIDVIIYE